MTYKLMIICICMATAGCRTMQCLDSGEFPVQSNSKTLKGTYCLKTKEANYPAIQGRVVSRRTGKNLKDVSVYVLPKNIGVFTDASGNFELVLPAGKYNLIVQTVGYIDMRINNLCLKERGSLHFVIYLGESSAD